MEVLKYNSNGFPLYWMDIEIDSPMYLKVFKRVDKNTSQLIINFPKFLVPKILKIWEDQLLSVLK